MTRLLGVPRVAGERHRRPEACGGRTRRKYCGGRYTYPSPSMPERPPAILTRSTTPARFGGPPCGPVTASRPSGGSTPVSARAAQGVPLDREVVPYHHRSAAPGAQQVVPGGVEAEVVVGGQTQRGEHRQLGRGYGAQSAQQRRPATLRQPRPHPHRPGHQGQGGDARDDQQHRAGKTHGRSLPTPGGTPRAVDPAVAGPPASPPELRPSGAPGSRRAGRAPPIGGSRRFPAHRSRPRRPRYRHSSQGAAAPSLRRPREPHHERQRSAAAGLRRPDVPLPRRQRCRVPQQLLGGRPPPALGGAGRVRGPAGRRGPARGRGRARGVLRELDGAQRAHRQPRDGPARAHGAGLLDVRGRGRPRRRLDTGRLHPLG